MVRIFLALLLLTVAYPLRLTGPGYGEPKQASWSPDGEEIAYVRDSVPKHSIFVIDADGSNVVGLTLGGQLVWSPDGKKITCFRGGDIFVMNADGSDPVNLTGDAHGYMNPTWSPNSRRIAYMRLETDEPQSEFQIWVMDADGKNKTQLTSQPGYAELPDWSPDGSRIVFQRESQIWVMDSDGSNQTQLTWTPPGGYSPMWSPDGKHVSYLEILEWREALIVMKPDGSEKTRIASEIYSYRRDWSPDGSRIAYGRDNEIWTVNIDGSDAVKIVSSQESAMVNSVDWSPDGTQIAFDMSEQSLSNTNIFVVNAGGGDPVNLTQSIRDNSEPKWSPDGCQILFSSNREFTEDIWITDQYGKKRRRIAAFESIPYDTVPVWSPDGDRIVVAARQCNCGGEDIYVVNSDGSGSINLTNSAESEGHPSWSADGTEIAYDRDESIWVMDADGGNQTQLTQDEFVKYKPSWSPDGLTIAYQARHPEDWPYPHYAIWIMDEDGSNQRQLTDYRVYDYFGPAGYGWSPDSKHIVFSGHCGCGGTPSVQNAQAQAPPPARVLCAINVDGSGLTLLVDESDSQQPAWSPDGTRITYTRRYDPVGPAGVYVVDVSTHDRYRVFDEGGSPAWSPDGTKLVVSGNGIWVVNADQPLP